MNQPIFVLGDLNCNMLHDGPDRKALVEVSTELNLQQIIKNPTRITDTTQSLIDVILVSNTASVLESGVLNSAISDHLPVYVILKVKVPKIPPNYITARSYKYYDPLHFSSDLAVKSDVLLSIFSNTDVNTQLETFKNTLHSTLDLHAPVKTFKVRSRSNPFISCEIKEHMKSRDKFHRRFLQTRDKKDWEAYKESRNNVKDKLKKAASNYLSDEVEAHKNNSSSLWKIVNNIIPSKEKEKQVYIKDLKILVEEFNQYFTSVGRNTAVMASNLAKENNIILSNPLLNSVTYPLEQQFNFKPVTCTEVQCIIIMAMPKNKSPGPDKINMRIIRDCLPVILGPLTHIINSSLLTGVFPNEWKLSAITPLYKDGDNEVASNNRPISLLEIMSKVCERVALDQFSSYLTTNHRLSPHQSGNRKAHSTETLNILVSDIMLEAIDKKNVTAIVLLDMSKAFDSVSHPILLHKLKCVGASSQAVGWFKSYLSGRRQYVRIGSTVSSVLPLSHGVPQGTILSPLLFCIYTNDIPAIPLSSNIDSYVDDSKLFLTFSMKDIKQTITKLENDLRSVAKWCFEHQLLINPNKTKFLLIGSRPMLQNLPANISLNFLKQTINPVTSAKDLGTTFDSNLSYNEHISNLTSSCIRKLCQINRVKDSFDVKTLQSIVEMLVINKLTYCSTIWSNTSAKNIKKLQTVQNFAARIITKVRKFDHITPSLQELNWLPIELLLLYRDTIMAYKCFNNLAPSYLTEKFVKRSDIHNRPTRYHDSLDIPSFKTSSGQRTFHYRAVKIWNDLDSELKQITNLNKFKKKLKEQLIRQFHNSIF